MISDIKCSKCNRFLKNPVFTRCKHFYCKECFGTPPNSLKNCKQCSSSLTDSEVISINLNDTRFLLQGVPKDATRQEVITLFKDFGTVLLCEKIPNRDEFELMMSSKEATSSILAHQSEFSLNQKQVTVSKVTEAKPLANFKTTHIFISNMHPIVLEYELYDILKDYGVSRDDVKIPLIPTGATRIGIIYCSSEELQTKILSAFPTMTLHSYTMNLLPAFGIIEKPSLPPPPPIPPPIPSEKQYVRTRFPLHDSYGSCLTFDANEEFLLISEKEENYYLCSKSDGTQGYVPKNYGEIFTRSN